MESQQTQDVDPMLFCCWISVINGSSTKLDQRLVFSGMYRDGKLLTNGIKSKLKSTIFFCEIVINQTDSQKIFVVVPMLSMTVGQHRTNVTWDSL